MGDVVTVLPETRLEFRHSQSVADPHDGLTLFGPYDADSQSQPKSISYALIGPKETIQSFERFSKDLNRPILCEPKLNPNLWPMYPGFEAAFSSSWPGQASRVLEINKEQLGLDSRHNDPNQRVAKVAGLYLNEIERLHERDERFDVIICVVPDFVHQLCRPKSRVVDGIGISIKAKERREREKGQLDIFETYDPIIYRYSVDFRRQLKARVMRYGIPVQIVRESTVCPEVAESIDRNLTPLSDRAWNLSVALYYKAGGKPWRLKAAREGVCYIGIAYRRENPASGSPTACCAAQMFLDSGDGIVFMGKYGPWYSDKKKEYHLTAEAACELLKGTLKTYASLEGKPLKEIFLHCRSGISDEEFSGFQSACPANVKLVGVRVRQERFHVRLYREGTRPVLRGTFWQISPKAGYLWASGFKPRLGTYDGWETPVPLRIDIQHGDSDIHQVASDILALTKLNYNAAKLGDSEPVTILFSDAVGEILVSNPGVKNRSPKFKFYI
jgi:hypothetical protein